MMNRWWIYQRERFPVFQHGLLILAFSAGAVGYSARLRGDVLTPQLISAGAIAFFTLFLFFLQLRIADEFKDFETDARYRPYRPVPRGLVTLQQLGIGAIAAGIVQLGLALSQSFTLAWLLLLVWGYMGLMFREFFVPHWLKAHPLVYMLSHAVIMPLMAYYAMACDWLIAGHSTHAEPPQDWFWLPLVSVFVSLAIELSRKIRAPQDEEPGVETYTGLWGIVRTVTAWLLVTWLLAIAAFGGASAVQVMTPMAIVLLILLILSLVVAWQFVAQPVRRWATAFERLTGVWTLLVFLSLGVLPWLTLS